MGFVGKISSDDSTEIRVPRVPLHLDCDYKGIGVGSLWEEKQQ